MSPAEVPPDWAQRFVDALQDCAAFLLDADGVILTWNPGVTAVLGFSLETFVGQHYRTLFSEESQALGQPEADLQAARAHGRLKTDGWLRHADGHALWRYGILCALKDDREHLFGFAYILQDQSEQYRRDLKLLESEARFRSTFENAAVGMAHVALDGTWLRVNRRLCNIVGFERHELEGLSFQALTHPEDLPWDLVHLELLRRGELTRFETDKRYIHKQGHAVWVHLTTSLERRPAGEASYFISIVEDIGDRKRAEQLLEQLTATLEQRVEHRTKQVRHLATQLTLAEQRERKRIAQALHDELQQDLYALQMQLHKLRRQAGGLSGAQLDAELGALYAFTTQSIRATRHLTAELSPPSRAHETLTEAFSWLADQMAGRHGLAVALDPRPLAVTPPELLRVLLVQIVRELLFNVVKHAGCERAFLGYGDDPTELTVTVRDEGVGAPRDAFDRPETGGFGLQSIRERLQLFGGRLDINSGPEGTTVTLTLPRSAYRLAEQGRAE